MKRNLKNGLCDKTGKSGTSKIDSNLLYLKRHYGLELVSREFMHLFNKHLLSMLGAGDVIVSRHRIVSSCPQRAYIRCRIQWVTLGTNMKEKYSRMELVGEMAQ